MTVLSNTNTALRLPFFMQCNAAVAAGVPWEVVHNDLSRSQLLSASQINKLGGIGTLRWRLFEAGEHLAESTHHNF